MTNKLDVNKLNEVLNVGDYVNLCLINDNTEIEAYRYQGHTKNYNFLRNLTRDTKIAFKVLDINPLELGPICVISKDSIFSGTSTDILKRVCIDSGIVGKFTII